MSTFVWTWAFVWLAGHLVLWHRVDGQWRDPEDERREEGLDVWTAPPAGALTAEGDRLYQIARPWSVVGFFGWWVIVVLWFAS